MQQNTKLQPINCGVRNYAWGQKAPESLVYQYSKGQLDQSQPYAELWMGSHESLPSRFLNNETIPQLKFLFKVLSVNQALSIQVHPNKEQAQQLHISDPVHYPDNNHKPEMAISLGDFEALSGLAPKETIINNLMKNPRIIELLGKDIWIQFLEANNIQGVIQRILNFSPQELTEICTNLILPYELPCKSVLSLQEQFKEDVGLVFLLLLNHVKLNEGEAIVLEAGSLHAYLKGNCLECMANSDNVVRAGFTDKFKDKDTLGKIMVPKMGLPNKVIPIVKETDTYKISKYETQFEEFLLYKIEGTYSKLKLDQNSIFIQIQNQANIKVDEINHLVNPGDTYFISQNTEIEIYSMNQSSSYVCTSKL